MGMVKDYLVYVLVRIFICVVQTLRMETCQALARSLAILSCDIIGFRRALVDDNLTCAFPNLSTEERRQLARRMWEHLVLLVVEVAHTARKIHETNWRDYVTFHNPVVLANALLDDRPLLLVSGHFGNFEFGGYVLSILGFPTAGVARSLDNPYLDRYLYRFRSLNGQRIIPKEGGYQPIVDVLSRHGTVSFLADQYAGSTGSTGCWVDFFGRPASTHKAIALFTLGNDAPMIVAYARRLGKPLHYEFGVEAIADPRSNEPEVAGVRQLTQWYTHKFENFIRRDPEQYWWVHSRWKDRRSEKKKRAKTAA